MERSELKDLTIPLRNLPEGSSEYALRCGDDLLGRVEGALAEHCDLLANISAHRLESAVTLDFSITGTIEVTCDLCLQPFDYPLEDCGGRITLELADRWEEVTEELYRVDAREERLDLAQWIYELSIVCLPIRREHPLDAEGNPTCDAEQLRLLDQYLVVEASDEDVPDDVAPVAEGETDPRWDALKALRDKN